MFIHNTIGWPKIYDVLYMIYDIADHVSMSGTSYRDEQNCNICDYTFTIKAEVMDDVSETGTEWKHGSLH